MQLLGSFLEIMQTEKDNQIISFKKTKTALIASFDEQSQAMLSERSSQRRQSQESVDTSIYEPFSASMENVIYFRYPDPQHTRTIYPDSGPQHTRTINPKVEICRRIFINKCL